MGVEHNLYDNKGQRIHVGRLTSFEELMVAERRHVIDNKTCLLNESAIRDFSSLTGSASISTSGGRHTLRTTAGADTIVFRTRERGSYTSGAMSTAGLGMRIPVDPVGNQQVRAGAFDDDNGYFFKIDSSGFAIVRRKGGVDNETRQDDFNRDKLDGSGPSGYTLDTTIGMIYQVDFAWYGDGGIIWRLLISDDEGYDRMVDLHYENPEDGNSTENPNQPISIEVDGDDAGTFDVEVGPRSWTDLANIVSRGRIVAEWNYGNITSMGTTELPVLTFRRKTGFEPVTVEIDGIDVIPSANVLVRVVQEATLVGASFGNLNGTDPAETAMESDTSATSMSGGNELWSGLFESGKGSNRGVAEGLRDVVLDVPDEDSITIAARTLSGSNASIDLLCRWIERW